MLLKNDFAWPIILQATINRFHINLIINCATIATFKQLNFQAISWGGVI